MPKHLNPDMEFVKKLNEIGDNARERGDFETINAVLRVLLNGYIDLLKDKAEKEEACGH
jgi:hypothetical protein